MADKDNQTRWGLWIVVSLAAIIGGWLLALWLILPLAHFDPQAKVSAVQAAFSVAFGVGGFATLALFARRQWHQELDAQERRITEQYMKAIEQLGHDKAPVRLGGLYALDRLGRDHPEQRRVIAEVWCAYLRQSYIPPTFVIERFEERTGAHVLCQETMDSAQNAESPYEEYEVRMTAQRLLEMHLRDPRMKDMRNDTPPPGSPNFWNLSEIDLTGATLFDANFADCYLPKFIAERACFYGVADFMDTRFGGEAWFARAHFDSPTFSEVQFHCDARFGQTHFHGMAWFAKVWFHQNAWFGKAIFGDFAYFDSAQFLGVARFNNVQIEGESRFIMFNAGVHRLEFDLFEHVWPPGWKVVPHKDHWKLVRIEPSGPIQESPATDNDPGD